VILASVPEHLRDQVRTYVRRASHLPVDPKRILRCACLLVAAERRPECHYPRGATLSSVPTGFLAALGGLSDAESEPAAVASFYRRLRRVNQQINMSAQAERRHRKKLPERCGSSSRIFASWRTFYISIKRRAGAGGTRHAVACCRDSATLACTGAEN
jgi:hypothetical protein